MIDFRWEDGTPTESPEPGVVNEDYLAVRWTGQVYAPASGWYTFQVDADDGARLWVDGQLLTDNWYREGEFVRSGQIYLDGGRWYPIRIEYFEAIWTGWIWLAWMPPGHAHPLTVPSENLRPGKEASLKHSEGSLVLP